MPLTQLKSGIDTKFAEDAIKYSRLAQWATSINSIIKYDLSKGWKLQKDVKGIMEAIGPNLYKLNSKSDIKNYTDLVLNTSEKAWRKGYESMLNDLRTTGSVSEVNFSISKGKTVVLKDIDTLQELWSLSSFTRAVQEIPELSKIFKERYDGANTTDFFLNVHNRDDVDDFYHYSILNFILNRAIGIKSSSEITKVKSFLFFKMLIAKVFFRAKYRVITRHWLVRIIFLKYVTATAYVIFCVVKIIKDGSSFKIYSEMMQ